MNDSKAMTKARAAQALANATFFVLVVEGHISLKEMSAIAGLTVLIAVVQIGYDSWRKP